jgi:hypothetical protein
VGRNGASTARTIARDVSTRENEESAVGRKAGQGTSTGRKEVATLGGIGICDCYAGLDTEIEQTPRGSIFGITYVQPVSFDKSSLTI